MTKCKCKCIAAHHNAVDGRSLGKHDIIVRFLRGAKRLNPPRPPLVPSWDLSNVLAFRGILLSRWILSSLNSWLRSLPSRGSRTSKHFRWVKSALCSVQPTLTLSWDPGLDMCPRFPPHLCTIRWWTCKHWPREEADPALALLCPVRALHIYVDRTQSFRSSEQLFVCYGGQQKGKAVSKQRLSHWIVDAITLTYQSQGEPCPLGVRAHSTRSVCVGAQRLSSRHL